MSDAPRVEVKGNKKPTGRLSEQEIKLVEKLASIQCSGEEVAYALGRGYARLRRKKSYQSAFKKGRELGKLSLRRWQFQMAEKNVIMAIFLGKNYLGQSDKQEAEEDAPKTFADYVRRSAEQKGILGKQKILALPAKKKGTA